MAVYCGILLYMLANQMYCTTQQAACLLNASVAFEKANLITAARPMYNLYGGHL